MQIRLSHSPEPGLIQTVLKNDKSVYTTPGIKLPHGELLLFDGYITKLKGKESEFFTKFLKDNGIRDLIQDAKFWDGCWSVVYVNTNGTIYCFTDPLGKKQLYYDMFGNICSEINPLVAYSGEVDTQYFGSIYKWGYNTDDRTPWENIKRLTPGRLCCFMGSELQFIEPRPYFDFSWPTRVSPAGFRIMVKWAIEDYVKSILPEPKSIAVLVSGGIDSSVVAYEILELKRKGQIKSKVNFYTINNQDDAPFVEIFAKNFGLDIKTLSYDMGTVDLKEILYRNETPVDLGSMVPNQMMFKAIPDKIIFTGDGPDELFGGYRRIDEYDSQKSDVFQELSYYHLPRLEKAAHYLGKELRCPWLSYDIVRFALSLPYEDRQHKSIMKEAYKGTIPDAILNRPKLPLKNDELRSDPLAYRKKLIELFKTIEFRPISN